jgi:hypothetical protein
MITYDWHKFSWHRFFIKLSLALYFVATWSSMAGMEIFGWLTFLLTMIYAYRGPSDSPGGIGTLVRDYLPWKSMVALYLVTIIGIFVNGTPEADKVFIIGSQRWMILLVSSSYALFLTPPRLRGYKFFLFFTTVIAAYAIVQSFTGIDLLRPGEDRAVQPLNIRKEIRLWRSAGLFGSPMGYVYIAGFHACLALAVALVFPKSAKRLRLLSLGGFFIIAASLVTTYVRGGWLAMACAYLTMAWFTSRRVFYWTFGTLSAGFAALFFLMAQVRERVVQLFDPSYASQSDRIELWKMNWRMFRDYPILGIGWEENETRACDYVDCHAIPKPFTGHAHNNFIQALSGMGIIGFTAFVVFAGFFLWLNYRLLKRIPTSLPWARAVALACLGGQVMLHVGGLTECNFKAGATNHNFMLVLGLVASLSYLEKKGLLSKAYASEYDTQTNSSHSAR